jgi:hypothetical protein
MQSKPQRQTSGGLTGSKRLIDDGNNWRMSRRALLAYVIQERLELAGS